MNLALLVSIVIFLIGALAKLFVWDLKKFDPLMWGLFFFALGHVYTYIVGPRQQQP